jgi:hypothetical protein
MKSFKNVTEAQEVGDCPCGSESPEELRTKMKKGKPEIVKEGEANYGGDYQAMVLRVKEKARQQAERKKQQDKEKAKDATDPNSDRFTSGPSEKPFKNPSIVKANESVVEEGVVGVVKKVWKAISDFDSSSPKYDGNTRRRQEQRKRLEAKKPVRESYNDNRYGFKRKEREDDEYHTPDPVGQTHKVGFHVSKDGEEKHHRTVTFTNSTKTAVEAKTVAKAHLQSKGYTIHEETMHEAKDEQEYGYEGDMAMNQLETVIRHATYLKDMMKPDTDLPEWVQSKITLATDYLQTACDYMTSEMKESVKDDTPPFDGPYKKTPKVVTDKSGAKHDPMSRARDLARMAAKRQSGLKKESLDESRKAEIVKEIMKGKKKQTAEKFEPNPELQSTVVKSDN